MTRESKVCVRKGEKKFIVSHKLDDSSIHKEIHKIYIHNGIIYIYTQLKYMYTYIYTQLKGMNKGYREQCRWISKIMLSERREEK